MKTFLSIKLHQYVFKYDILKTNGKSMVSYNFFIIFILCQKFDFDLPKIKNYLKILSYSFWVLILHLH